MFPNHNFVIHLIKYYLTIASLHIFHHLIKTSCKRNNTRAKMDIWQPITVGPWKSELIARVPLMARCGGSFPIFCLLQMATLVLQWSASFWDCLFGQVMNKVHPSRVFKCKTKTKDKQKKELKVSYPEESLAGLCSSTQGLSSWSQPF